MSSALRPIAMLVQVGDAYIVVGGATKSARSVQPANEAGCLPANGTSDAHTAEVKVAVDAAQYLDLAQSRALLDRMFVLAYSMQVYCSSRWIGAALLPALLSQHYAYSFRCVMSVCRRHCMTCVKSSCSRCMLVSVFTAEMSCLGLLVRNVPVSVSVQVAWSISPLNTMRCRVSILAYLSAGVLGPAIVEAERAEKSGLVDGVSCSGAAQRVYLSSTFRFVERAEDHAVTTAHSQSNHSQSQAGRSNGSSVRTMPGATGGLFDVALPDQPSFIGSVSRRAPGSARSRS
jgi:hypothetical protein